MRLKIGVLGTGHLGKIHLKCLQSTEFQLMGFYDPDDKVAAEVEETFKIKRYLKAEQLILDVDAVDIVTPTPFHYEMSMAALNQGRHIFVEKPVTHDIDQARALVKKVQEVGVIAQVGHVERYNPAFKSLSTEQLRPKFIEAHRLATFNARGNDVSVVLDLMIHDLDLILNLVKDEVIDVHANGVSIVNKSPDICNARITFANGCVANVTSSRISMKNMRKLRLFQEDAYISIDFLEKESQIITLTDNNVEGAIMPIDTYKGKKYLSMQSPEIESNNAIVDELSDFYRSITENTLPKVTIEDGFRALELASRIEAEISQQPHL